MRWSPLLFLILAQQVVAGDILSSNGYQLCQDSTDVQIRTLKAQYDRTTRVISFDIDGTSKKTQNVTAAITVTAYGQQVYDKTFNPCDYQIAQLCPVPATNFSAHGNQTIPEQYANQIPSIAFTIPDLDGLVKLQILSNDQPIACVESSITNGKTVQLPAVQYVGAGVAGVALVTTALSAVIGGAHPGASSSTPSFGDMMGWFQGMAMNGMLSVSYPPVYQSFASNFGFSTGLIASPWLQRTIDNFRASTGGNLTNDNYDYLKNATLVYSDGSVNGGQSAKMKRGMLELYTLFARDGPSFSLNGTDGSQTANSSTTSNNHVVSGIEAYVEQLMIPQANTFMTLLLIWALVISVLIVLILFFKLLLELFTLWKPLPKTLESWRRRYWWRLAKAITGLIVILYGVWTMYCIYQFTNGDSWVAKLLAGLSLGIFTTLLLGFFIRIVYKARQLKRQNGDVNKLYEDKETWIKYSLFYDSFKRTYWWIFIPLIIGACARGAIVAGANGHGLVQTIGHIIVDGLLLIFLLWTRPYQSMSGNVINIVIQTVRVLSVVVILVFVEELGVSSTAKTIAGLALIITQAVLTGLLAILLLVNMLIVCIRRNPEIERRRKAEKNKGYDQLTALDADNTLLMQNVLPLDTKHGTHVITSPTRGHRLGYSPVAYREASPDHHARSISDASSFYDPHRSKDNLVAGAASMGRDRSHSRAVSDNRVPTLPRLDIGQAM